MLWLIQLQLSQPLILRVQALAVIPLQEPTVPCFAIGRKSFLVALQDALFCYFFKMESKTANIYLISETFAFSCHQIIWSKFIPCGTLCVSMLVALLLASRAVNHLLSNLPQSQRSYFSWLTVKATAWLLMHLAGAKRNIWKLIAFSEKYTKETASSGFLKDPSHARSRALHSDNKRLWANEII